jgi:hypothetical protein
MQNRAWGYSVILHVMLFLLIYFGLPSLMKDKVLEDNVVMVEILPVSEITNVKVAQQKPKPEPKKETKPDPTPPKPSKPEPEKPKPVEAPKPEPVKQEKPEPIKAEPIKPIDKPKEVKKEEKKPEPKKPEKKQEADPFDNLMKNLEQQAQEEKNKEKEKEIDKSFEEITNAVTNSEVKDEYKPNVPVSASVKDSIRKQVSDNWSITSGAKDAKDMVVTLTISMAQDGSVTDVVPTNMVRYNTDAPYRAMVDSCMRAVRKASPIKGLPVETYQGGWDEIEMNFDPGEMLY